MSTPSLPSFNCLEVQFEAHIAELCINRPDKANAMNLTFWQELGQAMDWVDQTPEVRVAIIRGNGAHFSAGIDLNLFAEVGAQKEKCEGRTREKLRRLILEDLQKPFNKIENCRKPVIAAIHGACIGGGVDLVVCCDMRYASADARFSIKEIDIGMTADLGTLQRLPKLIAPGLVRELAFTGREFLGNEAQTMGLVNACYADQNSLLTAVREIAGQIAEKSPLSIRGIKEMLNYARDHSVADGLNYIATWNAAMLLSNDIQEAMGAKFQKRPAQFED